ncbi:MAG: hypothetical protein PUD31_03675 [Solobacterium sp.]|nr:hypothetical protein [Solobacterium sp.]MDY3794884.1 hypothetical protein [Erysipelotrichaceae bacterium]MDY4495177.1 hypothetical protein [Erysipelotrichaceae bacterium]MDY4791921.1 hypothetical protein [Erysipelotrichaceae bacterium]MDY5276847.1 hypothetical protein [Erysipelotrichaceae bacterium]
MRRLFNELGLSVLAATCSIIVIDIFMTKLDISDFFILWLKRLMS